MGGLFRRHELDAFVSQGPQVNGIEQPLASTEQGRRDCDVHLIDKASTKILLDGVGSAANTDVHPFRCVARLVKRLVNATRDEVKHRTAFHLYLRSRVVSQDEDWNVIRRGVSPPPRSLRLA